MRSCPGAAWLTRSCPGREQTVDPVNTFNPTLVGGIVVGLVIGFVVGRRWAEYFRAEDDGRRAQAGRRNYRGRSTLAFILGGLIILGVAIAFGSTAP